MLREILWLSRCVSPKKNCIISQLIKSLPGLPIHWPAIMHAPWCVRPPSFFSFLWSTWWNYHIPITRWAIPVCLFFSWVYMRTKYHWTQLLGVFICIAGLGLLVVSDQVTKKDWQAVSRGKGDAFMIAGATLYGFSEFLLYHLSNILLATRPLQCWYFYYNSECNGRIPRTQAPALRGWFFRILGFICFLNLF